MSIHDANKAALLPRLMALCSTDDPARRALLDALLTPDATWHMPHPLPARTGADAIDTGFWQPLKRAFPDLERRDDIAFAGTWRNEDWVTCTGHYMGSFLRPFLGIAATGGIATLRYGEFYLIRDGRVAEVRMLLDLIDLMRQAGVNPLPRSAGVEGLAPGPATRDGVSLAPHDAAASAASLHLVESMIGGLLSYDQRALGSMGMERFWSPTMCWYGPCGIGANRGIKGFQDFHQRPFLHAFPDRTGGNHRARIAEGAYVASTGWPSVTATFSGDYLGVKATGQRIGMRVMDWWRRDGDKLAENWVLIDLPELLQQMGANVFAALQARA